MQFCIHIIKIKVNHFWELILILELRQRAILYTHSHRENIVTWLKKIPSWSIQGWISKDCILWGTCLSQYANICGISGQSAIRTIIDSNQDCYGFITESFSALIRVMVKHKILENLYKYIFFSPRHLRDVEFQ